MEKARQNGNLLHKRSRRKASFTSSNLANVDTPIYRLATKFQDYLFFPDPSALYALAGALVANMMVGHPVWLMLIGPQSCGKSVLLKSLLQLENVHGANEISGTQALLSGVKTKERWKGAKGGLLNEIGEYGALVIEEFTSVLESEELSKILAAFRSIYYNEWTRDVGTEGHRRLHWQGKLAMFGGCTNVLDQQPRRISSEMGERWIYYRFEDTDGWQESNMTLTKNLDPDYVHEQLCAAMIEFVDEVGVTFVEPVALRELGRQEIDRLIAIAQFSSRASSAVMRDTYSKEIIDVAVPAPPMRLVSTLGQVYRGLELAGLAGDDIWRVVSKLALDCMPLTRRQAIKAVQAGRTKGYDWIGDYMRVSGSTAKRTLEDLKVHHILGLSGQGEWSLSDWTKEIMQRGGFEYRP